MVGVFDCNDVGVNNHTQASSRTRTTCTNTNRNTSKISLMLLLSGCSHILGHKYENHQKRKIIPLSIRAYSPAAKGGDPEFPDIDFFSADYLSLGST